MKEFGVILVLLAIFGIIAFILGRTIAADAQQRVLNSEAATLERIAPVGQVRVAAAAEQPRPAAKPAAVPNAMAKPEAMTPEAADEPEGKGAQQMAAAAPAAQEGRTGKQVYQTICMACHVVGVLNAPKTGDTEAWKARAAAGLDAMVQAVIKGKGAMPPMAGNPTLTEQEIVRAIQFFLEQANVQAG